MHHSNFDTKTTRFQRMPSALIDVASHGLGSRIIGNPQALDQAHDMITSHSHKYVGWIGSFAEHRYAQRWAMARHNVGNTSDHGIPQTDQQSHECVRRLWAAFYYYGHDTVEAEGSSTYKRVMTQDHYSAGDVEIQLWTLLGNTINAQRGVCDLPPACGRGATTYQRFGSFEDRLEQVINALKVSKANCCGLFTGVAFTARLAWNPGKELGRKKSNQHGNGKKREILQKFAVERAAHNTASSTTARTKRKASEDAPGERDSKRPQNQNVQPAVRDDGIIHESRAHEVHPPPLASDSHALAAVINEPNAGTAVPLNSASPPNRHAIGFAINQPTTITAVPHPLASPDEAVLPTPVPPDDHSFDTNLNICTTGVPEFSVDGSHRGSGHQDCSSATYAESHTPMGMQAPGSNGTLPNADPNEGSPTTPGLIDDLYSFSEGTRAGDNHSGDQVGEQKLFDDDGNWVNLFADSMPLYGYEDDSLGQLGDFWKF
ncbi:hypothetical protein F4778DRAFT_753505 [Xylariomycetidae sp. FL2044]|nr:hypothetical protein F4778DRAFT_753505 [Xylariomycetidae sp. FL2044]